MATRVAEIFVEVGFNASKVLTGLNTMRSQIQAAAHDIASRMDAVRKSAEFTVRLQGITGVVETRRVLDGIVDKIVQAKHEMQGLGALRAGIPGVAATGPQRPEVQTQLNAIDERRAQIISQVTQLLQLRSQAEAKLGREITGQTQSILAQARAEDANRASKLALVAEQQRMNQLQGFAAGVIDRTTTAEERQTQFLHRLSEAYNRGFLSLTQFNRGMAFAGNIQNFAGMGMGANRANFALQQLSFGIQDFMQQLGPMGLAGALSASANNWSMVAQTMFKAAGPWVAIGITAASVLPAILKTASATEKTAKSVDLLANALERLRAVNDARGMMRDAGDVSGIDSVEAAAAAIRTARADAAEAAIVKGEREDELATAERLHKAPGGGREDVADLKGATIGMMTNRQIFAMEAAFERLAKRKLGPIESARLSSFGSLDMGGGSSAAIDTAFGTLTVQRPMTADEREKSEERIVALKKEVSAETDKIAAAELRERAVIERNKQIGQERLQALNRELAATDELSKKLLQIDDARRKRETDIRSAGTAAGSTQPEIDMLVRRSNMQARSESQQAIAEDEKKRGDEQKRKQLEISRLTRDIEKDSLNERAAKFKNIADQLSDKRDAIVETIKDPAERRRLLNLAGEGAERELASMRPKGGDKIATASMADSVQKAISSGTLEKSAAETAKNTAEQKGLLEKLIGEVKKGQVGIAG